MQDFFYVRKNARYEKINFAELIYVKAMWGYMQLVTERQIYFVLVSIKEVQKCLPPEQFCRTHRSYIVGIHRIQSFDNFNLMLEPAPEGKHYKPALAQITKLPIGKNYRTSIRKAVKIIANRMGQKTKIVKNAEFKLEYDLIEE
jgi:DNA-binding LytR/AlgR family response regulator